MSAVTDYICLDLETTGLSPKTDRIIEIGAVKVRNGEVVERFHRLVDPRMEVAERIEELTGIKGKELAGQPLLEEVLPALEDFLEEDILIGHRISFDYAFLKRAFVNQKKSFDKQGVDTLRLARALVSDCTSKRLESLCQHFSISLNRAHRAQEDAEATAFLYQRLVENYYREEVAELFRPQTLVFKLKKEGPITKAQLERLQRLIDKYEITPYAEIKSLTKNEASRYLDRIYAEHGR